MNCDSFLKLQDEGTSTLFISELIHAVMQSEKGFEAACKIINKAKKEGCFKNVRWFPPYQEPEVIYQPETTTIA